MTKVEILSMMDADLDKKVKIQGTPYDRKRRVSDATIKKMVKMFGNGKTVSEIASKLGLCYHTVHYNVDPVWRAKYNATRNGAHTGKDKITVSNRIAYKRMLVAAGKVTA